MISGSKCSRRAAAQISIAWASIWTTTPSKPVFLAGVRAFPVRTQRREARSGFERSVSSGSPGDFL